MTLTITCWSDEDPAVRHTRNHDNLMCERDYRDANPPADGWDDLSDLLDTPTFPVYHDETRDADGELLEEFAEPHREVA